MLEVRGENTYGVAGRCLEPHDLLISKYLAGRPKDLAFCSAVARAGLVRRDVMLQRLADTACSVRDAERVRALIVRHFGPA